MGGKSFIHLKRILVFGAAVVAFFVLSPYGGSPEGRQAYAFGHPDTTTPSIAFTEPDAGFPMNPKIGTTVVSFETKDTTLDDSGGAVVSCTLSTKNGSGVWLDRSGIGCNADFSIQDGWCDTEGANTCGVRIKACDSNSLCVQGERFFTIDYTPPVIEISSNRSHPTQKRDVEFLFSASDGYGIQQRIGCSLGVPIGPLPACSVRKSYSGLQDGVHSFRVSATDKAGNSTEKILTWEIDSTPPALVSNFIAFGATYFSEILDWNAPTEFSRLLGENIAASQYDIRYSVEPITQENWNDTTALVYREIEPKFPGPDPAEIMTIGPNSESDLESKEDLANPRNLGNLSTSNLLSANTKHYFAIKTRDEKWNWSGISTSKTPTNKDYLWTLRDPCDYDADRTFSPKSLANPCGPRICDPAIQPTIQCDLYDNPFDWGLPNENPDPYDWSQDKGFWPLWPLDSARKDDDFWLKAFGATAKDLDLDGTDVASRRIGKDVQKPNEPDVTGHPDPGGKDWYDNPFTLDLLSLTTSPTLKQLSYTINDLDLDTFVSKNWKQRFAGAEKADTNLDGQFDADIVLEGDDNVAGCIYPGAREDTCFNCTA